MDDTIFKLDKDFDLLADDNTVYILRPTGFEFMGQLKQAILDAVPQNAAALRQELAFVDFDSIEQYASTHPRAARYLASIRSQTEAQDVDRAALKRHCEVTGVEIADKNGNITITSGSEMGFLEVLDRRRYIVELVEGRTEQFKAASRTRISQS